MRKFISIIIFLLVLPHLSWAANTVYVDPSASGCGFPSLTYDPLTRSCGSGNKKVYDTIQNAISGTSADDTIYVMPGTHYLSNNSSDVSCSRNVIGYSGNESDTIIDGSGGRGFSTSRSEKYQYLTFQNFASAVNTQGVVLWLVSASAAIPEITHCIFKNITITGNTAGVCLSSGIDVDPIYSYCQFYDITINVSSGNSAVIKGYNKSVPSIDHCTFGITGHPSTINGSAGSYICCDYSDSSTDAKILSITNSEFCYLTVSDTNNSHQAGGAIFIAGALYADAPSPGNPLIYHINVYIDNISVHDITCGEDSGAPCTFRFCSPTSAIHNSRIYNNQMTYAVYQSGYGDGAAIYFENTYFNVYDSEIDHNTALATYSPGCGGPFVYRGSQVNFYRTKIHDNSALSTTAQGVAGNLRVHRDGASAKLYYCAIYNGTVNGGPGGSYGAGNIIITADVGETVHNSLELYNCVLNNGSVSNETNSANDICAMPTSVDHIIIENTIANSPVPNILIGSGNPAATIITSNIRDQNDPNPLITSNFHLIYPSPCIDTGTDISQITDLAGAAVDSTPNIGVYEGFLFAGGNLTLGLGLSGGNRPPKLK